MEASETSDFEAKGRKAGIRTSGRRVRLRKYAAVCWSRTHILAKMRG
jgi:hypothetical protein